MEAKYKIGDKKNFSRNKDLKLNKAKIVAVELPISIGGQDKEAYYIIEHPDGFSPDVHRVIKYDLDKDKTYLFVKESELI